MKILPTLTGQNQSSIKLFQVHLKTLGYSKGSKSMLPACAAEFLQQLEQKGIYNLHQIKPQHVQEHYEHLNQRPNKRRPGGLSSRHIGHHLYSIRLFLDYLEQTGQIAENPSSGLVFPKAESATREILTPAEITLLYDTCNNLRERAVLSIFYGCGLRRSEGESLNINDVQFRQGLLYVREGKGRKRRAVPMGQRVADDIKNYLHGERFAVAEETAMITNRLGKRTSGNCHNNAVKRLVGRAGIKKELSLHSLRHSIATHLLDNGLPVEHVRDFLGHDYLEATQIYTHINRSL